QTDRRTRTIVEQAGSPAPVLRQLEGTAAGRGIHQRVARGAFAGELLFDRLENGDDRLLGRAEEPAGFLARIFVILGPPGSEVGATFHRLSSARVETGESGGSEDIMRLRCTGAGNVSSFALPMMTRSWRETQKRVGASRPARP